MNTVSNIPGPGLAPELPLPPAAIAFSPEHKRTLRELKDILITIYAYGLLSFGLFFPFALAAWTAFFGSGPR